MTDAESTLGQFTQSGRNIGYESENITFKTSINQSLTITTMLHPEGGTGKVCKGRYIAQTSSSTGHAILESGCGQSLEGGVWRHRVRQDAALCHRITQGAHDAESNWTL